MERKFETEHYQDESTNLKSLPEVVCYVTKDNIIRGESNHLINVEATTIREIGERMNGDGFTKKFENGKVVAISLYDNLVYETIIENTNLYPRYSECDGPDGIRGVLDFYYLSEDVWEYQNSIYFKINDYLTKTFVSAAVTIATTIWNQYYHLENIDPTELLYVRQDL